MFGLDKRVFEESMFDNQAGAKHNRWKGRHRLEGRTRGTGTMKGSGYQADPREITGTNGVEANTRYEKGA